MRPVHAGGKEQACGGAGNMHAGGDMHARLLPARLPPHWELGQIARLPPPVCRQITFDYPANSKTTRQKQCRGFRMVFFENRAQSGHNQVFCLIVFSGSNM